jgi:hypothetical protein
VRFDRILGLLLIFVVTNFYPTNLLEDTYYVSPIGSDQNGSGGEHDPWGTISYALSQVPDESLILVQPGTYFGQVRLNGQFLNGVIVKSLFPYQAKLRNSGSRVVTCFYGQGITIEGFDIAHSPENTAALVIQIQDLLGVPGIGDGTDPVVRNIVLRNNIIHDSTNNDLLKINNGARDILVEGNMFFNQQGSDEHIDVNSVVGVVLRENIFFNYFEENSDTSSFIVIKDSNSDDDGQIGSESISLQRNIFLNWQGSSGHNFILIGEDGKPYFEARDVLVENNLMIGNSENIMRSPIGVKGGRDIVFRNNTIVGNLPAHSFAMRLNQEGQNPKNENVSFYNNIWSDPTGTMGLEANSTVDFAEVPNPENGEIILDNNLYWNGGQAIPTDQDQRITYMDDLHSIVLDPRLGEQGFVRVPYWNGNIFYDGSGSIMEVFRRLVYSYSRPTKISPIINRANSSHAPLVDLMGNLRDDRPDIGAYEYIETLDLYLPMAFNFFSH